MSLHAADDGRQARPWPVAFVGIFALGALPSVDRERLWRSEWNRIEAFGAKVNRVTAVGASFYSSYPFVYFAAPPSSSAWPRESLGDAHGHIAGAVRDLARHGRHRTHRARSIRSVRYHASFARQSEIRRGHPRPRVRASQAAGSLLWSALESTGVRVGSALVAGGESLCFL